MPRCAGVYSLAGKQTKRLADDNGRRAVWKRAGVGSRKNYRIDIRRGGNHARARRRAIGNWPSQPLGDDKLLLHSLSAGKAFSPFHFELEMLSADEAIDPAPSSAATSASASPPDASPLVQRLRQPLRLRRPERTRDRLPGHGGPLAVVPPEDRDCRIFQNKTASRSSSRSSRTWASRTLN